MRTISCIGCFLFAAACAPEPEVLPPLGEALVVVDTDAPVPRLVSRLRIDIYDEAGTWIDSREVPMRRTEDWPASFSVFMAEGSPDKRLHVRLRTYRDGKVRDYRGERFQARPDGADPALLIEPPQGDGLPRLMRDGVDVTPASEPLPALTIDRLMRVLLHDGERGVAHVVLRMACFGTMTDMASKASCVEVENEREPVGDAPLDAAMVVPPKIGVSPFGAETPCMLEPRPPSNASLYDEEVCVPGGAFMLGSPAIVLNAAMEEQPEPPPGAQVPLLFNSTPERLAIVSPLLFDAHEVTVGRWRHAVEVDGFVAPDVSPLANDGPLPSSLAELTNSLQLCTWSTQPLGRETFPLNCVGWWDARAFCQFYGGDLPTESEWEYVAMAAGREQKTSYPWGSELPTCDRAVYGRVDDPGAGEASSNECENWGFGPASVEESANDVTPQGVFGLGGNMAELLLDSYRSFSSACWLSQNLLDPRCWEERVPYRSFRGGTWRAGGGKMRSAIRQGYDVLLANAQIGFRCMRRGVP